MPDVIDGGNDYDVGREAVAGRLSFGKGTAIVAPQQVGLAITIEVAGAENMPGQINGGIDKPGNGDGFSTMR